MTTVELDENIEALKDLAGRLAKMAEEVESRRDSTQARSQSYSAAYNMVIRSIEEAAVTASAMADVSQSRRNRAIDETLASA